MERLLMRLLTRRCEVKGKTDIMYRFLELKYILLETIHSDMCKKLFIILQS